MTVWLIITILALVAAVVLAGTFLIVRFRHFRGTAGHGDLAICLYLDDNASDLSDHPLQQQIEKIERRKRNFNLAGGRGGIGQATEKEQIVKYENDAKSISVIREIIAALDRERRVVHVDLTRKVLEPDHGLKRALWRVTGKKFAARRGELRLSELRTQDVYVWINGLFRVADKNDRTTTFCAPYGQPADPTGAPRVSVTCNNALLRRDIPAGTFPARCLGRIQAWDQATGTLVIDPVLAIFQ